MNTEILPDGGSIEASPSYSHFIARLYLDSYLLLKNNDRSAIPGLRKCIKQQYSHLAAVISPQGLTLQISDSYAMDAHQDLAIVRDLFPVSRTSPEKSICFHDSCIAVLRNNRLAVYVDGMQTGLFHHHPGKPNILIFADGMPLLIDSGCCNYDRELRTNWLQTAAAHNVAVVVPQKIKETWQQKSLPEPQVILRQFSNKRVVMEHTFKTPNWQYIWTRTLSLTGNKVTILDRVDASLPVRVEQHFHIASLNVVLTENRQKAIIQMDCGDVTFEQTNASNSRQIDLAYRPAIGSDNRECASADLMSIAHGKQIDQEVLITLP